MWQTTVVYIVLLEFFSLTCLKHPFLPFVAGPYHTLYMYTYYNAYTHTCIHLYNSDFKSQENTAVLSYFFLWDTTTPWSWRARIREGLVYVCLFILLLTRLHHAYTSAQCWCSMMFGRSRMILGIMYMHICSKLLVAHRTSAVYVWRQRKISHI